ncbi:MAG: preprotein translocase subunit YajC [Phycisphaeraceae bacterium]|nr:preprotein translocase subunit YajC [Phycisphaerae bacterium]MBX3391723.1 preprotein translocase subunit YajC [Phycisphaeraceae bacterium]
MNHPDWFAFAAVSMSATMQAESGGGSGSTPVNVVGLPSGSQPSPSASGEGATSTQQASLPPAPPRSADLTFVWMMGGVMLFIIAIQVFAGRGERKRRQKMMSTIGKGDRVVMSGGVIGTIAELGETEVVVRVEEGRIRFAKSSIQQVIESVQRQGAAA